MKRILPKFYVYEHWRPDTDVCFYVGKGSGKRAWGSRNRNKFHVNVVKKLTKLGMCVEVRMVASGLIEAQAFALEIERIAFWRALGVELVNATLGGEGPSGFKLSSKHKAALLAANIGKSRPAEVCEKIRVKLLGKKNPERGPKISAALKGKKLTRAHRAKLALAQTEVMARPGIREYLSIKITGRKHTPEACILIGNVHRGKIISEQTRAKIKRARKKQVMKPMTAETKAKIGAKVSAAAKRKRLLVSGLS